MCENMFEFGDYVEYQPGYLAEPELGRVTEDPGKHVVFVCYHDGCTAAASPRKFLTKVSEEHARASKKFRKFGFNRFDAVCEKYDPDACFGCNHHKFGKSSAEHDQASKSMSGENAAKAVLRTFLETDFVYDAIERTDDLCDMDVGDVLSLLRDFAKSE